MPGFCITPGYKISAENGEVGIEPFDAGVFSRELLEE